MNASLIRAAALEEAARRIEAWPDRISRRQAVQAIRNLVDRPPDPAVLRCPVVRLAERFGDGVGIGEGEGR